MTNLLRCSQRGCEFLPKALSFSLNAVTQFCTYRYGDSLQRCLAQVNICKSGNHNMHSSTAFGGLPQLPWGQFSLQTRLFLWIAPMLLRMSCRRHSNRNIDTQKLKGTEKWVSRYSTDELYIYLWIFTTRRKKKMKEIAVKCYEREMSLDKASTRMVRRWDLPTLPEANIERHLIKMKNMCYYVGGSCVEYVCNPSMRYAWASHIVWHGMYRCKCCIYVTCESRSWSSAFELVW